MGRSKGENGRKGEEKIVMPYKNKEDRKVCQAKYYQEHKETIYIYKKKYYQEHKGTMNIYNKKSYLKNRKKRLERMRQHYKERTQFINDYKLLRGCLICGYNKCVAALDFHHNGDKEFDVGKGRGISLERLKKEMDKCDILCANCHRELHYKELRKQK